MSKGNAAYHFPPFHPKLQRHKRADRRVHKARLKKQAVARINMYYPINPDAVQIGVHVSTHGTKYSYWDYSWDAVYKRQQVSIKNPPMPEIQTHAEMQALIQEDEGKMEFWPTTYQSQEDYEAELERYRLDWEDDERAYDDYQDDWGPEWDDWRYEPSYDSFDSQMTRRYVAFADTEYRPYLSEEAHEERREITAWLNAQIEEEGSCYMEGQTYNGEVCDGLNPENQIQRLYWDKGMTTQNITNQMFYGR